MKKYLGIICLLYSGIIFYVWFSGMLKNFLSTQMQVYIKIVAIPIFIMGIISFSKNIEYKFKISDLLLFLPLIMLIGSGDGRLSLTLAQNRMGNFGTNKVTIIEEDSENEIIDSSSKEINDNEVASVDFEIIDQNYDYLSNYLTFSEKATRFRGSSIKVRGFSITEDDFLPEGYFALGKYIITCCTADAAFGGFYVKYDLSKIKNNTWYEIEGILNSGKDPSGHSIMYISVTRIKEINSDSEEQYAYPCYSYDDGLCKDVTKYNIGYEV